MVFHFLPLCVFMSIQNMARSFLLEKGNGFYTVLTTLIKILIQTTLNDWIVLWMSLVKLMTMSFFRGFQYLHKRQFNDVLLFLQVSWIDQLTCYKNPDKTTCIDLILMNRPNLITSKTTMSLKQASPTFIWWLQQN